MLLAVPALLINLTVKCRLELLFGVIMDSLSCCTRFLGDWKWFKLDNIGTECENLEILLKFTIWWWGLSYSSFITCYIYIFLLNSCLLKSFNKSEWLEEMFSISVLVWFYFLRFFNLICGSISLVQVRSLKNIEGQLLLIWY